MTTNLSMIRSYQRYRTVACAVFAFIAALTLLGTVVSIACTFWADALRRTRDIAVLRVFGAPPGAILALYLLPAQLIGLLAAGIAFGVAWLLMAALRLPEVAEPLRDVLGVDLAGLLRTPWWAALLTALISAAFCLLGSAFPAWRASRQPVAFSLRQAG